MKITKMDQTKIVNFKDIKVGSFFTFENNDDLMVKLVREVEEGTLTMNSFSIKSRNFYLLDDDHLCIPIEIEEIIYKEVV